MSKKKNFYVVWKGHEPGIYPTWEECKKQIHGFENAVYKGFATEEEAKEAFRSAAADYIGNSKKKFVSRPTESDDRLPIQESISVDAACSGNPGLMEYRGVYTKTGEEVFRQGPFAEGTNNIGEFLGIVHALAWLKQKNSSLPIYSDSVTAISWIKAKKHNSKLKVTEGNKKLFDLLERAEKWLAENNYPNAILKWDTERWGEIPADFGRK